MPPWRDGTTHLMMSPLEFMRRLAALVLRPRLHQPKTASRLSDGKLGDSCQLDFGPGSFALQRPLTSGGEGLVFRGNQRGVSAE